MGSTIRSIDHKTFENSHASEQDATKGKFNKESLAKKWTGKQSPKNEPTPRGSPHLQP